MGVLLFAGASCAGYYNETSLARLNAGMTKAQFFAYYGQGNAHHPILRASKVTPDGQIDVATVPLQGPSLGASDTDYWFVFKNDRLVQWGRPEDWRNVSATYQIDFNPSPSVRTP